jgi:hypothetical protein
MDISQIQKQISDADNGSEKALPPVDKWDPPFCGDMNLVIKRSGQWWHEGTPFTRAKLIKLLASVLKKENDKYFLVTPGEKIGIQVEDVPFVVIDATASASTHLITVSTQTGDTLAIGDEHPVELREFEGNLVPYCHIRRNLWARVHQNVLYRWVDQAQHSKNKVDDKIQTELSLTSGDYTFCIGRFNT